MDWLEEAAGLERSAATRSSVGMLPACIPCFAEALRHRVAVSNREAQQRAPVARVAGIGV